MGKDSFSMFPNPATGMFNLVIPADYKQVNVSILDMNGRTLQQIQVDNTGAPAQVMLNNIAAGVYLVRVEAGTVLYNAKLIVQ
jgi:hypothetical protein